MMPTARTSPYSILAAIVLSCIAVSTACGHRDPVAAVAIAPAAAARTITFDDMPVGQPPPGFLCSQSGPENAKPARWQVVAAADAPSKGQVLEQSDNDDSNGRFPVALLQDTKVADVSVSVSAKAVSGGRDRSFGVVVRASDERTYYVARANSSTWGENVRFYKLVDGKRTQLDEWEGDVKAGVWHQLQIDAIGATFSVTFDGKQVLRVHDTTLPGAGMVGVWTKAESVSQFDNFTITPVKQASP
jgi:hypothetical protein